MFHYFTDNENLESKIRIIEYNYKDYIFKFYSDIGVFSKDKIDFGSRLLLETFLSSAKKNEIKILDVGCGYGFLGICLAKITNSEVDLIDINKRALHLAEKNIKENQVKCNVFISDAYKEVAGKYDLIISNPPIRVGKEILLSILTDAKNHLNDSGELWFVIRKDQGAKSVLKYLENVYYCKIIARNKGFFVIKAEKH